MSRVGVLPPPKPLTLLAKPAAEMARIILLVALCILLTPLSTWAQTGNLAIYHIDVGLTDGRTYLVNGMTFAVDQAASGR